MAEAKKSETKKVEKKAPKAKKATKSSAPKRKRVVLTFHGEPGWDVYVAGSFNDWKPNDKQMKEKKDGEYTITLMLPVGEHHYKFIANGRWQADPNSENWSPNPFGSLNSVVAVSA